MCYIQLGACLENKEWKLNLQSSWPNAIFCLGDQGSNFEPTSLSYMQTIKRQKYRFLVHAKVWGEVSNGESKYSIINSVCPHSIHEINIDSKYLKIILQINTGTFNSINTLQISHIHTEPELHITAWNRQEVVCKASVEEAQGHTGRRRLIFAPGQAIMERSAGQKPSK